MLEATRSLFGKSSSTKTTTTMPSEASPLLPSNASGAESSKYYFLKKESRGGGTNDAVRDEDGEPVHENLPRGATEEEFAPRVIGSPALVRAINGTAKPLLEYESSISSLILS